MQLPAKTPPRKCTVPFGLRLDGPVTQHPATCYNSTTCKTAGKFLKESLDQAGFSPEVAPALGTVLELVGTSCFGESVTTREALMQPWIVVRGKTSGKRASVWAGAKGGSCGSDCGLDRRSSSPRHSQHVSNTGIVPGAATIHQDRQQICSEQLPDLVDSAYSSDAQ